jgi:hypothetical protein
MALGIGATGALLFPRLRARLPRERSIAELALAFRDTPRAEVFGVAAKALRAGVTRELFLGAVFRAGSEDVRPRPHGILHCVMDFESNCQLADAAAPAGAWLPALWNLHDFKTSQARDKAEDGDWKLPARPVVAGSDEPAARREFLAAMDAWDPERADRALLALLPISLFTLDSLTATCASDPAIGALGMNLLPIAILTSLACAASDPVAEHTPTFEPAGAAIPVGPMAGLPELADFDGDGNLDVVLACGPCCGNDPDPASGHVALLLGDGMGGLRAASAPVKIGDSALRVAVGDVNGDGRLDVASIQHNSYEASVLQGDGRGGFVKSPTTVNLYDGRSPHVHSVVLADVNEDGHLDLLATLVDDHALAVHLGDGLGGFSPATGQPFFAHYHPYEQLVVQDVNDDGHVDVLCTDLRGNGITVLVGSGTGMFAPEGGFRMDTHTSLGGPERPISLALGDLDDDGLPDAVTVLDDGPWLVVLEGLPGGRFRPHEQGIVETVVAACSVRLADLNGDGALDVVTGSMGSRDGVSYLLGRGDGSFGEAQFAEGTGTSAYVALGDLNGDDRVDIVASSYDEGTVRVLLNRPPTGTR